MKKMKKNNTVEDDKKLIARLFEIKKELIVLYDDLLIKKNNEIKASNERSAVESKMSELRIEATHINKDFFNGLDEYKSVYELREELSSWR